jgi:D-3-phosphoglycerate dehydrogenase / 2-oxoglutarate reductase
MKKILVNLSNFYFKHYIEHLASALPGYEIEVNTSGKKLNSQQLTDLMTDEVVGMIAGTESYSEQLLLKAPNLHVISRCGIGVDNIDSKQAKLQGIRVINTPDAPTAAVAELTVSLMLALLREVPQHDADLRQGKWSRRIGKLLSHQRVGLIGYGRIGRAVAKILSGFGCEIIVADQVNIACDQIVQVTLDELLTTADVVSLHCPLAITTRELINLQTLEKMKQSAILINTARGELINEVDLYYGLKNGMISAAALDVFQEEPYSGALCDMPNVVVTPHIGSCALESRRMMEQTCVENLIQALST